MATKNNFTGNIPELLILYFLDQRDCYVYEITRAISELSDEELTISQNTIYTAAYKLENDQMISEYSKLVGKKRTRVYYHIEDKGRVYLKEQLFMFLNTYEAIKKILSKKMKEALEDETE